MKKIVYFLPVLSSLLIFSCKDLGQGPGLKKESTYPISINNSWKYSTDFINSYYNNNGIITDTEHLPQPNTDVKIASVNDSIGTYTNLVKFEYYEEGGESHKSTDWYIHNNYGLTAVAYLNPGTRAVVPKRSGRKYLTFDEFKEICRKINMDEVLYPASVQDSIQFYEIPREVLKYPLVEGQKWVELRVPFYRERTIKGIEYINLNGENYRCYRIEAFMPKYNFKMIDFISTEAGLVKREISSDSLLRIDEFGNEAGYLKSSESSLMISRNF